MKKLNRITNVLLVAAEILNRMKDRLLLMTVTTKLKMLQMTTMVIDVFDLIETEIKIEKNAYIMMNLSKKHLIFLA